MQLQKNAIPRNIFGQFQVEIFLASFLYIKMFFFFFNIVGNLIKNYIFVVNKIIIIFICSQNKLPAHLINIVSLKTKNEYLV